MRYDDQLDMEAAAMEAAFQELNLERRRLAVDALKACAMHGVPRWAIRSLAYECAIALSEVFDTDGPYDCN